MVTRAQALEQEIEELSVELETAITQADYQAVLRISRILSAKHAELSANYRSLE